MEEKRADTKPLSFIGKSEIAQKAETAEARAEDATKAMQEYIERGERRQ
jgi:hypothetical protein